MKEIAANLGLSTRTVEGHKYEMMEALGVTSTAELVGTRSTVDWISSEAHRSKAPCQRQLVSQSLIDEPARLVACNPSPRIPAQ